jgi:hypothetical protein
MKAELKRLKEQYKDDDRVARAAKKKNAAVPKKGE